jgi:hypothetical protein
MKAIVITSFFTQGISATQGETIDIQDQKVFDDLLKAGFIKAAESENTQEPERKSRRKANDTE